MEAAGKCSCWPEEASCHELHSYKEMNSANNLSDFGSDLQTWDGKAALAETDFSLVRSGTEEPVNHAQTLDPWKFWDKFTVLSH